MARALPFATLVFAQGGPPLLTDDPGTPGNRNWEINVASMPLFSNGGREIQAPLLDINYGWGERIQLKYQTAYFFDSDGGGPYRGAVDNSLLGVKWRFYQQSGEGGWNISTYPQLELNNPDNAYDRGLVERGPRFLLPVEISKVFGPIEVNLEVGYWFISHMSHDKILGLAIGRQFTKNFEGLAEIYDGPVLGEGLRAMTANVGGRYEFHTGPRCNLLFIFMAGRSPLSTGGNPSARPSFIGYFGLQMQIKGGPRHRAPNRTRGRSIQNP